MKSTLSFLILVCTALVINAQSLDIIVASTNVTDAAQKKFEVLFNSTQTLTGADLAPMNIWVKIPDAEAAGSTISFVNNPFNLQSTGAPFSGGNGFTYYAFQTVTAVPPSTFPLGVDVFMGELQVTGPAVNVTLNGEDFGDAGSGSNWPGTAVVQGTDNLLVWPLSSSQVLPIDLKSFTASVFEEFSGKLEWETASETNGSHFEIFRSTDTHNWESIGVVNAVGESSVTQQYEFIDRNVGKLRNNETYYYQLKMVDLDGSSELSGIRSITFNFEGIEVSTYPNPTREQLFINIISDDDYSNKPAEVHIFDNSGKFLQKNTLTLNGITDISVVNIPTGIYVVKIIVDNNVFTRKLIKVD